LLSMKGPTEGWKTKKAGQTRPVSEGAFREWCWLAGRLLAGPWLVGFLLAGSQKVCIEPSNYSVSCTPPLGQAFLHDTGTTPKSTWTGFIKGTSSRHRWIARVKFCFTSVSTTWPVSGLQLYCLDFTGD
jgi:hypothetical protein